MAVQFKWTETQIDIVLLAPVVSREDMAVQFKWTETQTDIVQHTAVIVRHETAVQFKWIKTQTYCNTLLLLSEGS